MTLYQRISVVTNVSIVCAAISLVVLVWNRTTIASDAFPGLNTGDRIGQLDVDWRASGRTLILALNKDCVFCTASAPFYRRLVDIAARSNAKLLVVMSDDVPTIREYLTAKSIAISEVRQQSLPALEIYATPTLVAVDSAGLVTHTWRGRLVPELEEQVIESLENTTSLKTTSWRVMIGRIYAGYSR